MENAGYDSGTSEKSLNLDGDALPLIQLSFSPSFVYHAVLPHGISKVKLDDKDCFIPYDVIYREIMCIQ